MIQRRSFVTGHTGFVTGHTGIPFIILIMLLVSCEPRIPENGSLSGKDKDVALDYSIIDNSVHPRLIFTDADFLDIKNKVNSNPEIRSIHRTILNVCDDEIISDNSPLVYKIESNRLLSVSRKAVERILFCAYCFRITGKSIYLDKAREDLLSVCKFKDWHPSHYLDVGEMATAVAIGYDWLYNYLDESDRATIVSALNAYALDTSDGSRFYDDMNNWNQVCGSGLLLASLATYEYNPSKSRKIVEAIIESNRKAMEYIYSPDGNYPEGYMYWGYGTFYEVMLLYSLNKIWGHDIGLSDTAGFKKSADFMLFMTGTSNLPFNYSDCTNSEQPKLAMWYFAYRFNDPCLLLHEIRLLREGRYSVCSERRLLPVILAFAGKLNLDKVDAPKSNMWLGNGVTPICLIRTGWIGDENDKYLGIKGGKASVSHGHMDVGSFVYDVFGIRWAYDLGMESYGPIESALESVGGNFWDKSQSSMRWKVYRLSNKAHNTIIINDTPHNVDGFATVRDISDYNVYGVEVDMSNVFLSDIVFAKRQIYINENGLIIKDIIKPLPDSDINIKWNMVTRANVVNVGNGLELSENGHTLILKCVCENQTTLKYYKKNAVGDNDFDSQNKGYSAIGWETELNEPKEYVFVTSLVSK